MTSEGRVGCVARFVSGRRGCCGGFGGAGRGVRGRPTCGRDGGKRKPGGGWPPKGGGRSMVVSYLCCAMLLLRVTWSKLCMLSPVPGIMGISSR